MTTDADDNITLQRIALSQLMEGKSGIVSNLFGLIVANKVEAVKTILSFRPELIQAVTSQGDTPLMLAALLDDDRLVDTILKTGQVNIEARNHKKETALIVAAYNRKDRCVKRLIDAGADVNAEAEYGRTALKSAISLRGVACAKLLLDTKKINLEAGERISDGTALVYAAEHGVPAFVEMLLAEGANIDARSCLGWTALYEAAHGNAIYGDQDYPRCIKLLAAAGSPIDLGTDYGISIVRTAARSFLPGNLKAVLGATAPVDEKARANLTATFISVMNDPRSGDHGAEQRKKQYRRLILGLLRHAGAEYTGEITPMHETQPSTRADKTRPTARSRRAGRPLAQNSRI